MLAVIILKYCGLRILENILKICVFIIFQKTLIRRGYKTTTTYNAQNLRFRYCQLYTYVKHQENCII